MNLLDQFSSQFISDSDMSRVTRLTGLDLERVKGGCSKEAKSSTLLASEVQMLMHN